MPERFRLCTALIGIVCLLTLAHSVPSSATELDWRGQVSGWTMASESEDTRTKQVGIRYLPEATLMLPVSDESFFDLGVSLNGFAAEGDVEDRFDVDFYRMKLRFATAQTETVLGLQKINFGPAQLLRALRWFDRLDPRDPQQLTEGVYGVRTKYTAMNNANLWLWALVGNDQPKGYEMFGTVSDRPEVGGRFQYPIPFGQAAATVHLRQVDASVLNMDPFTEKRFALDARWDVEIGLWIESVAQQQSIPFLPFDWVKMNTIGADYTVGLGNGIYILGEHLVVTTSDELFSWDDNTHLSAFSLSYLFGLFDSFRAIGSYQWDEDQFSQYVSWQRTYDSLLISLGLFHYPEVSNPQSVQPQTSVRSGTGGQLVLVYHH